MIESAAVLGKVKIAKLLYFPYAQTVKNMV